MLISDSESASQETQSATGNGMDVKRNVLLTKYSYILSNTYKFKEWVNFYKGTSLNFGDSERLEDLDGRGRSAEEENTD